MNNGLTRRELMKYAALLPFAPEMLAQCVVTAVRGRFALSAIGWIDHEVGTTPATLVPRSGNRLRWFYPAGSTDPINGGPTGVPQAFVIEKSVLTDNPENLFDPNPQVGRIPTMIAPRAAWTSVSLPVVSGSEGLCELPASCQALYLDYNGEECEVIAEDSSGVMRSSYILSATCRFYIEAPEIKRLRFPSNRLLHRTSNIKFLDLYNDGWQTSPWKPIATVDVRGTLSAAANALASGHDPVPQGLVRRLGNDVPLPIELLDPWKAVLQAFSSTSGAGGALPTGLTPWDVFSLSTQASWKTAVLSGFGYIDGLAGDPKYGRDSEPSDVEHLSGPSNIPSAYRVRTIDSTQRSNYVIVNPGKAPALMPPKPLTAGPFAVRPTTVSTVQDGSTIPKPGTAPPLSTILRASGVISWTQRNYWESGIDMVLSPLPPGAGGDGLPARFVPRIYSALSREGVADCQFDFTSDFSPIDAISHSFDGFDRVSDDVATRILPKLEFQSVPPVLQDGIFDRDAKTVTVTKSALGNWQLDQFSAKHDPHVLMWQRVASPASQQVDIVEIKPAPSGCYEIKLRSQIDPHIYVSGLLSADPLSARIESVVGSVLTVVFPLEDGACGETSIRSGPRMFSLGHAQVIQSPSHPALWRGTGTEWPLDTSVPGRVTVQDKVLITQQLPPVAKTEIAVFAAQVRLGSYNITGPFSNTVSVLKLPVPPSPPGVFNVSFGGVDYYGRTLVEIALANEEDGVMEILWSISRDTWKTAPFHLPSPGPWVQSDPDPRVEPFLTHAQTGSLGKQSAFEGRLLYEMLPIDYYTKDVIVTVAVRRYDDAGQTSGLSFAEVVAPAP